MSKHKHAELIKQWADGAEIEVYCKSAGRWYKSRPSWDKALEYRVKPKKPLRFILVREVSGDSSKVSESFPHKNVETYFKLHELVQEHETDWLNQDYEVFKSFDTREYKKRHYSWCEAPSVLALRMSKQCAEKLCELLNNNEVEL